MNRRTILLALGAAGALLAVWYFLLWSPQSGRLSDAQDRTAAAVANNEALQLRLSRLQAAKEKQPVLLADFERLESAVPPEPELARFILDANDAATESGVDFLSISPGLPQQTDPRVPASISLSITVKGGYFEALDYLEKLNVMSRVVVIDTLALTPASATSQPDLTIAITARMFTTEVVAVATATPTTPGAPGASTTTTTTVAGSRP